MNNMELETDIEALDMEMGDITIHYCPVIPNPEGEPTAELKTADIEGTIYKIVDEEARTELENKVAKEEGKGLSENDYTDEDKAIVDGVTEALDGKADKDGDKVLSDNNYSDEDKEIVDGVTEALNGKADKSDTYTKLEVDSALDNKVDKVEGKDLSENDFTDTLKDKLDGIEAEANKTVVDNSVTATSTNPVESKAIYNLLNDLLPEAEETGNPIAISNASGFNAKALTVDMLPIQDLHGYDKPWAGGSGKNKCNVNSGNNTVIATNLQAGTWTFSMKSTGACGFNLKENSNAGAVITSVASYTSNEGITFTLTEPCNVFINGFSSTQGKTFVELTSEFQIESGSTATSFAPYSNICPISGRNSLDITVNGNTETVNFGETVYGGTCDVVNGGTSVNYDIVDLGTLDWQIDISVPRFLSYSLQNLAKTPASNSQPANIKSPIYETLALGSIYAQGIDSVCALSTGGVVSIVDRRFTTVADFKTAMSGFMLCYELATPTTLTTPATSISLNKGNNTLSTSGDNMDLKYSTTISNPTSLTMARPSLGMIIPTIDSTEDTRLLNNANIEVVEEPTETE